MFSRDLLCFGQKWFSNMVRDEEARLLDEAVDLDFQEIDFAIVSHFLLHAQRAGDCNLQIAGHGTTGGFAYDEKISAPFH